MSVVTCSQILGIIFYQNEDGDVLDIQADIIGPGEYYCAIMLAALENSHQFN